MDAKDIKQRFQASEQLYQNILKAKQEILKIHKLAKEELEQMQRILAREEIKKNKNHLPVREVIAKTDIHLSPITKNRHKAILLEQYLNKNFEKLMNRIEDGSINREYRSIQENSPNPAQLWGVVWRFTSQKRKQEILDVAQKTESFNNQYAEIENKIKKELYPILQFSEDFLWEDFNKNEVYYYEGIQRIHGVNKARISTEDYIEHKENFRQLTNFQIQLEQLFLRRRKSSERVEQLIQEVNKNQVLEELNDTSMDEFQQLYSDSNLRLHLLAQNGIMTVGEMNDYPTFLAIPGIGEVTNHHLQIALSHYKDEINKSITFHFDAEHKTKIQEKILRNLFVHVNYKDLSKNIDQIELQYVQLPFLKLLEEVFLRSEWAMQQLSKNEKLYRDYKVKMTKLKEYMKRHESTMTDYQEAVRKVSVLSKSEIWSDFNARAADYYAVLEKHFGIGSANVENTIKRSGLSNEIIQKIKEFELNEEGLNATLRSWQDFGTKYVLLQKKVLIGDEMGLGKTLISIASMVHLTVVENRKHYLVICPASIMANWERELMKFSNLKVFRAHGPHRDKILDTWKRVGGVAITTYETSSALDFNDINSIDMLTVDEAHYVKNPHAKRTMSVRDLTAMSEYVLYLTGTPLENKVNEMTQIIKPLAPEIAQDLTRPRMTINSKQYRQKVAPVYLRRTKEEVSLELPPLTQIEEWKEFGLEEFEEYKEAVANGKFMKMRQAAWSGGSPHKSPKLNRLLELTEEAFQNENKVIVFTFFRDVIETVVEALGESAVDPIHGDVPIQKRQEIIDEFRESDTKNVLVAQINTAAHGLNIQFANTIIFCEPQIKPSLETQAVARAYRMGQVDNVFVYRLLTENSIDELMIEMLGNKQALFDEFADRSYLMEEFEEVNKTEKEKNIQNKIIDIESTRLGVIEAEESKPELKKREQTVRVKV